MIKYTDTKKIDFDIKLSDFGFTRDEINSSINTFSNVGTPNYMAPEIETFHYNNKCDLWSLGVILYELYTNKYIFYSDNRKVQINNRYDGKIVNETDNEMINNLIRKLIQIDIEKRIQWEEYFNDDFFKNRPQTPYKKFFTVSHFKVVSDNLSISSINIFVQNPKVKLNKKKRQENFKTSQFNIETINKDTNNKIKNHFYKNLFTENFSKKIFSENYKETINALNDIKYYLKKTQNLNTFFDNIDIILRILCQKIYDNQISSLAKNFFEFLQNLLNS